MTDDKSTRRIRARLTKKLLAPVDSLPTWNPGNLAQHFEKRIGLDQGCLEEMIEIEEGLSLARGHYRQRSEEVISDPALIARYRQETSEGSGSQGEFKEPRDQFTDRELMTAITTDDRRTFVTCYHWHFDRLACQGKPDSEEESGRQIQKVARRLRDRQKWKKIKDLKFLES